MEDRPTYYDTVEERYQKVKSCVQKFFAFQIGLSCFKWVDKKLQYQCRPFCFFVYPKSSMHDNDTTMLFQTSAVNFLSTHNFDFNKLFAQAISYFPLPRKEELRTLCGKWVTKSLTSRR